MRKSRAETAETRRRIVETAAEEFRKHGIRETSLNGLMAAAGLTEGGFYRHFKSKDQLIAEACAVGTDSIAELLKAAAKEGSGKSGLQAIIDNYLSPDHQNCDSQGCPFVFHGSELARADEATRTAATEGFKQLVDVVARQFPKTKPEVAKEQAEFIVCALVGALTMSRMVSCPDLAHSLLETARKRLSNG